MSGAARPIALLGLRASGKSTVGPRLAARLGRPFADADVELARTSGLAGEDAGALLVRVGEPAFRELERACLAALLARDDAPVLATGGGCVVLAASRAALAGGARCVWLRASTAELERRLRADPGGRPALRGADPAAEVAALAREREPLYASLAELVVAVDGRDADALARELAERLDPRARRRL